MKTLSSRLLIALMAIFMLYSCSEKNDSEQQKLIVKIGAQSNTSLGAFYSFDENKVYAQDAASAAQDKIDVLCFFEGGTNDITLASPGAGIKNIFTGTTSPDNWSTKLLTYFTDPVGGLTVEQFDQLKEDDAVIESYFDKTKTSGNKKANFLKAGDTRAFMTQDSTIFGVFKVLSVENSASGYVEVELKLKQE